jgi:predicted HTH domain antitoxin
MRPGSFDCRGTFKCWCHIGRLVSEAQVGYNHVGRLANGLGMVEEVIDVAVRSWMLEQLVKVERHQPEMVDRAVKEMLAQQSDLRWSVVVGAYLDGEINLGKAAELLGMHRLELQERFIAQSIPVRVGPDSLEEARAELAAIESWNAEAEEAEE